mmetsp:Transcript_53375/g.88627  ORF Transcript_53375/g.88627 Transcript_53375/m.88627 type:complete len:463 (+) Transcript_53375:130-1518(+)
MGHSAWASERAAYNTFPHAERPLVVLKLARTGSTWLAEELSKTRLWCGIRGEALNALGGLYGQEACSRGRALLRDVLTCHPSNCMRCDIEAPFAGVTLNIMKNGAFGECWRELAEELKQLDPAAMVVSLTRNNVVEQAASLLKSQAAGDKCGTPYHLENCPWLQTLQISPDPSFFLKLALSLLEQSHLLRQEAEALAAHGDTAHHITFEEMLSARGLPPSLERALQGEQSWGPTPSARSYKAATLSQRAAGSHLLWPRLANTLSNFDKCVMHFRAFAPAQLQEMLEGRPPPTPPTAPPRVQAPRLALSPPPPLSPPPLTLPLPPPSLLPLVPPLPLPTVPPRKLPLSELLSSSSLHISSTHVLAFTQRRFAIGVWTEAAMTAAILVLFILVIAWRRQQQSQANVNEGSQEGRSRSRCRPPVQGNSKNHSCQHGKWTAVRQHEHGICEDGIAIIQCEASGWLS